MLVILLSLLLVFSNADKISIETFVNPKLNKKIIIDAGHGGFDGGATSVFGDLEKDINLEISKSLCDTFKIFGFDVVMTRNDDKALARTKKEDMYKRLEIIRKYPDSIFLSIHQNHYSEEKYFGPQMFYGKGNGEESKILAEILQQNFKKISPDNIRQVKESYPSLFLFKKATQPSVLIECGFLSNNRESALLKSREYQKKIAFIIVESVLEYYNLSPERNIKNGTTEV